MFIPQCRPGSPRVTPGGEEHASPAAAYFATFRRATERVARTELADDPKALQAVADAFRAAEAAAGECVRHLGWHPAATRALGQEFSLATGEWLMQGAGAYDALLHELRFIWRMRGSPEGVV